MGRTFNNQEVADFIASEGMDYAIMHYFNPDSIEDEELRRMFIIAFSALNEIEVKLEEYLDN